MSCATIKQSIPAHPGGQNLDTIRNAKLAKSCHDIVKSWQDFVYMGSAVWNLGISCQDPARNAKVSPRLI